MNRDQALKWCVDNLNEWPVSIERAPVMSADLVYGKAMFRVCIAGSSFVEPIFEWDWQDAKQQPHSDSESVFADGVVAMPGIKPRNKYQREIKPGVWVDVYDVLNAFDPDNRNAADDHAIKKMLLPGKRGAKDAKQDREEAIQSLKRSLEILG